MKQILGAELEAILADEQRVLRRLLVSLAEVQAQREDLSTLERSIDQLDQLFLLVVVGEFNSGKSTLINALLGYRALPEGVTPTTQRIHRLGFGDAERRDIEPGTIEEIEAPVEILKSMSIVDTPGTNAIERHHEALTTEFVPQADLALFVTSADRPFTESERQFMEGVRQWGKKIVLVINKIDILSTVSEVEEVEGFVARNALQILGQEAPIFAVSARRALAARVGGDSVEGDTPEPVESDSPKSPQSTDSVAGDGGFAALERYLVETLDDTEKIRLELGNPLGIGKRLCDTYLEATQSRLDLLREDIDALDDVDRQLDHYRDDMQREFRFRLSDVDTSLHELERRGIDFFDETLRLPRAIDLLNKAKIQADFERQVIGKAPEEIEQSVQEIIDWMVASELRQWKSITKALDKRRSVHEDRIVGEIGTFDYDREQLLNTVGRAAKNTVDLFDHQAEASRMAESVQTAVAGAALIEVGAIGLGTLVTVLATSQLADFTGLLAASTLAVVGLLVLPTRRRKAKRELTRKIQELREDLMRSLTEQFDHELERSLNRIADAIAPYTRFVRAERGKLEESHRGLEQSQGELVGIQARLEEL